MKKILILCLSILMISALIWADDSAGSVTVKYTGFDNEDSKIKAAEYRDDSANAGFEFDLKGFFGESGLFLFSGHHTSTNDQAYDLSFWTGRHGKLDLSYNEYVHNLTHDLLINQDAAYAPKANWHTDHNPGSQYGLTVRDLKADFNYAVHGYENMKLFLSYSKLEREGMKQGRVMSHCANCHVNAMDREIDESTEDIKAGASATFGNLRLMASHLTRTYSENAHQPTFTYNYAEHPTKHVPVFDDRIQYDISDGALPYDQVPEVEKSETQFRLDYDWASGNFMTSYTVAEVNNETADLDFDYSAWLASGAQRLGEKTWLKLRVRSYEIDNSDVFVDVIEPVAIGGPYVGLTYREMYGYNPDFLRTSAMNRTVTDGLAEIKHRYSKNGAISFGYRYLAEDRDNFEVSEGEMETVTGKFFVDWKHRIPKSWKMMAKISLSDISNPYGHVDGGCSDNLNPDPIGTPLSLDSLQYWEWQDARQYNLSNQPSESMDARFSASRAIAAKAYLMLNARYTDQQNDELDFSTWDREFSMFSAYLNWMPSETWAWFAGYNYMEETSQTHICVPVFDG